MSKPRGAHVHIDIYDFKSGPRMTSIFSISCAIHNYIGPCYFESGQKWSNLNGRVTTRTTFDIMYSEMQMVHDLINSALQDVKWIQLHYVVDGFASSPETIDINISIVLEMIMLSFLSTRIGIFIILSPTTISIVVNVAIIINFIAIFSWIWLWSLLSFLLSLLLSSFFELI